MIYTIPSNVNTLWYYHLFILKIEYGNFFILQYRIYIPSPILKTYYVSGIQCLGINEVLILTSETIFSYLIINRWRPVMTERDTPFKISNC